MGKTIRFMRGDVANLPELQEGEPGFTLDTKMLYIGHDDGNVTIGGSQSARAYYPNYEATDQGVTGDSDTIKYAVDTLAANNGTIYLRHSSGAATTTYTLSTSETIGETINLVIEKGALISIDTGKTLTIYSPANIIAAPNQQIFSGAGAVAFSVSGTVYVDWFKENAIPGTTDMYSSFLSALTSISLVGGTVQFLDQTYTDTTETRVELFSNITIAGMGKHLTKLTNAFRLNVTSVDNVVIRDFEWEDSSDNIIATNVTNLTVENVIFDQLVTSASPDGILMKGVTNARVNGCYFDNAMYGVKLDEGGTAESENVEVSECTFYNSDTDFGYPAGVFVVSGKHIRIINNHFEIIDAGTQGYGIYQGDNIAEQSIDLTIQGNTFKSSHYADIRLKKQQGATIVGNTSTDCGVFCYIPGELVGPVNGKYMNGIAIIGNTVSGTIYLTHYTYDVQIVGNTIHDVGRGIRILGVSAEGDNHDIVISGNVMRNISRSGISLQNCSYINVSNNIIIDANLDNVAPGAGIDNACINLYTRSNFITVSDNQGRNTAVGGGHAKYGINIQSIASQPNIILETNYFDKMDTSKTRGYYTNFTPTTGFWNLGDRLWITSPTTGNAPGMICIFRFNTTASLGEIAGSVNVDVTASTGALDADIIGVTLDSGVIHWTSIASGQGTTTLVLTAAIPAGNTVAIGNAVYINRWALIANIT